MCGIFGYWDRKQQPLGDDALRGMAQALLHRGPDDEGIHHQPRRGVALGNRRLSIIDLGGGLKNPEAATATPEEVTSVPFRHVLGGMLNPAVQAKGPRPVNMSGFLSVMGQAMIGGNQHGGERFGDRSYAIVSDRYLNFSSRVGYHYAILDTWCGDTLSKNYIRFEFAGGAAGNEQRARRVRCIGLILTELGFTVVVTG